MNEEIIEITISEDGSEIKLETMGFVGSSCGVTLEGLGKALGYVSNFTAKGEYYDIAKETDVIITNS